MTKLLEWIEIPMWWLILLSFCAALGITLSIEIFRGDLILSSHPAPSITATSTYIARSETPAIYQRGYFDGYAARSLQIASQTPPSATQANLYEINLRLDALDGGKVSAWNCPLPWGGDLTEKNVYYNPIRFNIDGNPYQIVQTVGKETPAQFGYTQCKLTP
jgi:hypothetical protein